MRDDLPTGTVTFLLTDVAGSTQLLHSLGTDAYAERGPTEDEWPRGVSIGVDETTVRNVEIPDERFES